MTSTYGQTKARYAGLVSRTVFAPVLISVLAAVGTWVAHSDSSVAR